MMPGVGRLVMDINANLCGEDQHRTVRCREDIIGVYCAETSPQTRSRSLMAVRPLAQTTSLPSEYKRF